MATHETKNESEERSREARPQAVTDRYEECWEGTLVMAPLPNAEHQDLVARLVAVFLSVVGLDSSTKVFPGVNVSDRGGGWTWNHRGPDVAVYSAATAAKPHVTHWEGGPDLAVEILSPGDRAREKIPFYASVGTRELWILDRDPWALEMYRLRGDELRLEGVSDLSNEEILESTALPIRVRLRAASPRPTIEIEELGAGREWAV